MWRVIIEILEKSWNFQSSIGNTVRDYCVRRRRTHSNLVVNGDVMSCRGFPVHTGES